jgi:hypothetical protein
MRLKSLVIFAAFSLLCQVAFSVYYSVAIVDQNTLINARQSQLNDLTLNHQQLAIQLSTLNSLSNFLDLTKDKPYVPVTSSINLN